MMATPHPNFNVGGWMIQVQRTAKKTPIFRNKNFIAKATLKFGVRGILPSVVT